MMQKIILSSLFFLLASCVTKPKVDLPVVQKTEKTVSEPVKVGIVVDSKDLEALDKMSKAVEAYVIKKDTKQFKALCQDKRFDCYVESVYFPKNKKKITRSVPPYASGSKMGLQGETRVQVKYDFYP